MKSFHFPLQRVLDWRGIQMRTEEERLTTLQAKLSALAHRESALVASQFKAEMDLLRQDSVGGSDLRALAAYRLRVKSERAEIQAVRAQFEVQIAEQRKRLLKARREYRILENLKEKRWKMWTYQSDREVEETAADSYISNWLRSNQEAG